MKLYFYKDNKIFFCYTECEGMNIFQFLKIYYEHRNIDYDWYDDIFRVAENCSTTRDFIEIKTELKERKAEKYSKRESIELPVVPEGILQVFTKYYPVEWLKDGISKEAMDKFNILYSISQNKIIIPHYDINNHLVGIRGRALNPWEVEAGAKYMPVEIEGTWYKHKLSLNLYGLNKTKEAIKENGIVYLFESEKSVLQMESFSIPNCAVAVCGSNFNKYSLNILLKECHPKEIIICFDNEELEGEDKYFNKLWNICQKYNNYCNFSFIYDREGLLQEKDSPSDRGEEIFRRLISRRVKVK